MRIINLVARHKLLWKIIFIFWLTTFFTILANIYITKEIALSEFKSDHFTSKTKRLAQEAVSIYESEGLSALQNWYRSTYRVDGLNVVLLDKHQNSIGQRHQFKGEPELKPESSENTLHNKPKFFNKHLLNLADQKVITSEGNEYVLRIRPSHALRAKFNPSTLHSYRLISSFIIIFMGSFWLYRSIAKPLAVLQEASKTLANGDFSVRTVPMVGSRKDELGQLAYVFDQMAIKVEALLSNQKQLFRDISHEIRTPLTRQKLAIELAKDSDTPLVFLDKIEHQNNTIDALINHLLTLMQLEDSILNNLELVDLDELIKHVIADAELDINAKQLKVYTELDSQGLFMGNHIMMMRALENIIMNAIKYSPEHGQIYIKSKQQEKHIMLSITDQGPGIPESDLEHILNPFYRSDQSRNQKTGGFGLGLAITHKIVEQHKGELVLRNLKPRGLEVVMHILNDSSSKNT